MAPGMNRGCMPSKAKAGKARVALQLTVFDSSLAPCLPSVARLRGANSSVRKESAVCVDVALNV